MVRTLFRLGLAAPLVAGSLAVGLAGSPASATTFTVTDPADDVTAPNTLRWAIAQAAADPEASVIEIAPGLTIDLTCAGGGALGYDSAADLPLTVNGNGASITQTCVGSAVLTSAGEDLEIHGTTIAGGSAGGIVAGGDILLEGSTVEATTAGGGITAYNGTATIIGSTLQDNVGSAGGGVGAIHVVIERSTLSGNRSTTGGGAWADQTLTVRNSTITANTATASGGGLYAGLNRIDLTYVTLVENVAPAGANLDLDSSSTLTAFASLIGDPLGGGDDCQLPPAATIASTGANISSDGSCGLTAGPGDLDGADPGVGPLAANGGPTRTRLPEPSSPALDRADCSASDLTTDQRVVLRPQGAACDAGAVEVEQPADGGGLTTSTNGPAGPAPSAPAATPVAASPRFTG